MLQVQVQWADDNAWAHQVWKQTVRELQRDWRKAKRRSDTPVPLPELPPDEVRPIEGAQIVLEGDTLPGGRLEGTTDASGIWRATVPVGTYALQVDKPGCLSQFKALTIEADQTQLTLELEEWSDSDIVTWVVAPSPLPLG